MKYPKLIFIMSCVFITTVSLIAVADDEHKHEYKENHHHKKDDEFKKKTSSRNNTVVEPVFKEECGSCHMLYPAALLPARSWNKMLDNLKDHFGENASLDAETTSKIRRYLLENSAESSNWKRARKILRHISPKEIPLRISETKYIIRKHHEIQKETWSRKSIGSAANCIACHKNAEQSDFDDDDVKIPR